MRYGDSRDAYTQDIALAMGFDYVDELEPAVQDLLRIESPARLEVILQIAETAAINCASYVTQSDYKDKLEAIEKMALAHAESKTAKVRELMEEILVIIGEEPAEEEVVYTTEVQYPENDDVS